MNVKHIVSVAAIVLAACSDSTSRPGGGGNGGGTADTGATAEDAAPGGQDAGQTGEDTGSTTDMDTGVAVDTGVRTSTSVGVERIELGTFSLDAMGEAMVAFSLPNDVATFMVIIEGPEEGSFLITKMTGPTGELVSDDDSMVTQVERFVLGPFAAQFKSPNRVVQDEGTAAFLFPNNPNVTVSGGNYDMTIYGGQGMMLSPFMTDVTVSILLRKAIPTAGRVDISLYFSGAGNLDAATAQNAQLMIDAIANLRTIYAQANIEIGNVAYYDIDPSYESIDSIQGPNSELGTMFKETQGRGAGLHYFFVNRFMAGPFGGGIGGISGGLPGAALAPGTVNSGVAVSMMAGGNDPAVLAHIMAHEGGHWLGLFHTSEITGTEDQMPDTPPGQMGNMFLMFPAVGGGQMISPSQAEVMLRHMEINVQ